MIDSQSIQNLIDQVPIENVIGEYVRLKRRGSNLIGLCPFHNEKTPSFSVSPTKSIYKCFGCGKAGSSVNFIMDYEQLSFPEAVRFLAKKYNIELNETFSEEDHKEEIDHRQSLFVAVSFASKYYIQQMMETNEGKSIGLGYFKERGFSPQIIEKFGLGYAPNQGNAFYEEAIKNVFKTNILEETGLISKRTDGSFRDFFIDRVLFPIHDTNGKIVGFGGRTLKTDKKIPKYINSPETPIYDKSKTLYGMYLARQAIRKADVCYLVEGYTDVIAVHDAGLENVVASLGTSLTEGQVKLIKRFTDNLVIVYDGDAAGIKAAERGIDLAIEGGLNVKVVLLPEGHDPDSFARSNDAEQLEKYISDNAKDFILFKTDLLQEEAKNDPVKRAALAKDLINSISLIPDVLLRNEYVRQCAQILEIQEEVLVSELNKILRNKAKKQHIQASNTQAPDEVYFPDEAAIVHPAQVDLKKKSNFEQFELEILRVLVQYGSMIMDDKTQVAMLIKDVIPVDEFEENSIYKDLFARLITEKLELVKQGYKSLITLCDEDIKPLLIEIAESRYETSENWYNKHGISIPSVERRMNMEVKAAIYKFKLNKVNSKIKALHERLKTADEEETIAILKEQMQFKKLYQNINEQFGTVINPGG